jgi:flagellum-specific ATP synthase
MRVGAPLDLGVRRSIALAFSPSVAASAWASSRAYLPAINRARQVKATCSDMEKLIRLGAYRPSSSPEVDEAIGLHKPLEAFLSQLKEESTSMAGENQRLETILQGMATEN